MIYSLLKGGEIMYMKNLKNTVVVRIDDKLKSFIEATSAKMGLCPSVFVRMTLYSLMANMETEIKYNADE